jgi:hypothetical protein
MLELTEVGKGYLRKMMSTEDFQLNAEGADIVLREGETLLHVLARKGFATLCALHIQNKLNQT